MLSFVVSRENRLQDAIYFSELYQRLNNQGNVLTRKWSIVYLLYTIGNDNRLSDSGAGSHTAPIGLSAFQMGSFNNQNTAKEYSSMNERISSSASQQHQQQQEERSDRQVAYQKFKSFENSLYIDLFLCGKSNESLIDMIYFSTCLFVASFEVDESELLRDVIFAFQGIDGKYVRYDTLIDGFVVDPKVGVPRGTRDLIRKLCELGWLFKKLKNFVDASNIQLTNGLIVQSFSAAIESELLSYYKLIASLESQIHSKTSITLRQLMVWTLEPMERLKTMAVIVDTCKGVKGGALLGMIQSYAKHGDPIIRSFVQNILNRACVPFFNTIKAWAFEGELEDPFQEFFVEVNAEVPTESMWFKKYSLRHQMLPGFLSVEFAAKILKIGKTINFIRHCCNDSEFVIDSNTMAQASRSFSYQNIEQLEVVISRIAHIADQRVMHLLFDKFKVKLHCTALRKYLLLGQGDFTQQLLDLLQPDLDKPSHTMYRHNLLAILESAIRGSNAQYDDKDVLDRLDVRMISKTSGSGWDIFCLDYNMTMPLNTIFTQETMTTYTKIFQFLWTIKRVESSLDSTWKRHMHVSKLLQNATRTLPSSDSLKQLVVILHICNIVRHNMVLFIGNVQYYLMFEVLECCWQELSQTMARLREDGDLDQLIQAHHKYLLQIIDQALLSKTQKDLKNQLEKVLHFVVEYIRTQDLVATTAEDIIQKLKLSNDRLMEQRADMMHDDDMMLSGRSADIFDSRADQSILEQCFSRVQGLKKQYEEQSLIFLRMLEKQQSNEVLEYLKYRLQYSASRDN